MTADSAQREPTMEEILASIRRIISEEDQPESGDTGVLELEQPFDEVAGEAEFDAEPEAAEDEFDMEAAMRSAVSLNRDRVKRNGSPSDILVL